MIFLAYISEPITFSKEIEGLSKGLIVPEGFVKDFHFSTEEHLMSYCGVVGPEK